MHEKYEVTWIVEGQGTRIIGDSVAEFSAGDVLVLGPGLPHQWQSLELRKEERAKALTLFIEKDFPSQDFWRSEAAKYLAFIRSLSHKGLALNGLLKKKVIEALQNLRTQSEGKGMLTILNMLQDIYETEEYHVVCSESYSFQTNINSGRIGVVTDYIMRHLDEKIGVVDLANLVHLHPNSLSREFKSATGFSVIDYINKLRISKACKLLIGTSKSVLEICYECGFHNLSNFNRQFKKICKKSPTEFKLNQSLVY